MEAGYRVRGVVRDGTAALQAGTEAIPVSDLTDTAGLRGGMAGAEVVVHLAARVHIARDSRADPIVEYRRVNVEGTRAVVATAMEAGVRRVVVASSVKSVGEYNTSPWTEATEPHPSDAYGVSKLEAERLALAMTSGSAVALSILRLPMVYGPGVRANALQLLRLVDRGLPLPFARIQNRRSFLYLGNAVAAICAVLASPAAAGQVFFLSDGVDLSTPELILLLAQALDRRARLVPLPPAWFRLAGRIGDVLARVVPFPLTSMAVERLTGSLTVDSSRLRRLTGFVPPFTPAQGWAATAAWYRGLQVQR